jgi:hypothetical protein
MRTIVGYILLPISLMLLAAPLMAGTIMLNHFSISYGTGSNAQAVYGTPIGGTPIGNSSSVIPLTGFGISSTEVTVKGTLTENDQKVTLSGVEITCLKDGGCGNIGISWEFYGGWVAVPITTLETLTLTGSGYVTGGQATFSVGGVVYGPGYFGPGNQFGLSSGTLSANSNDPATNGSFSIGPLGGTIQLGAHPYTYLASLSLGISSLDKNAVFVLPGSLDINVTESVPEPSLILLLGMGLGAVSLVGWCWKK